MHESHSIYIFSIAVVTCHEEAECTRQREHTLYENGEKTLRDEPGHSADNEPSNITETCIVTSSRHLAIKTTSFFLRLFLLRF